MATRAPSYYYDLHTPPSASVHVAAFVAVLIVDEYPRDKPPPTAQQLMDRYGMNRATAYRWRAAICAARGLCSTARADG